MEINNKIEEIAEEMKIFVQLMKSQDSEVKKGKIVGNRLKQVKTSL